jgi:phage gp36-like protein
MATKKKLQDAKERFYTYNVSVTFNMQFTFNEKEVQPSSESGEGGDSDEFDPTDKALADLEQEIKEYLSERYPVKDVEAFADSDELLGVN